MHYDFNPLGQWNGEKPAPFHAGMVPAQRREIAIPTKFRSIAQ